MANLRGRVLLLDIDMGGVGGGSFQSVASIRGTSVNISNNPADASTKDTNAGYTARDASVSLKDITISVDGIIADDDTAIAQMRTFALSTDPTTDVRVPDGTGKQYSSNNGMVIDSFETDGSYDTYQTYSMSLLNAADMDYDTV